MDKQKFSTVASTVIDNLEGGYFHPNMIKDGRVKDNPVFHKKVIDGKQVQSESGETMYGLDRANGGSLNTGPSGKAFWELIDKAGASKPKSQGGWAYNYKATGETALKLKQYLADIMFPAYDSLSKKYLPTKEAQQIVDADPRLSFHFAYATWNGPGFFKKFAMPINTAIASGIKDPDQLAKIASDSRANSDIPLIKQSSGKITSLMESMKSFASAGVDTVKENPIKTGLIIGFFLLSGYVVWYKFIKK